MRALGESFSIAHARVEPMYRLSSEGAINEEIKTGLSSLVWKNFGAHYRRFKQKLATNSFAPTDFPRPSVNVDASANHGEEFDLFAPLSPLSSVGSSPTVRTCDLPPESLASPPGPNAAEVDGAHSRQEIFDLFAPLSPLSSVANSPTVHASDGFTDTADP